MNDNNVLLKYENVKKVFYFDNGSPPLLVVDDLSLEVMKGEILVLLGPSGCGKTTLLRISAGLDFPTEGSVIIDGKKVLKPDRDRGMVFQHYSSFPWLTVLENIKFALRFRSDIHKSDWDSIALGYLKLVGLNGFENLYLTQLSGGMQQRLAIARTLASDPLILLMDEPFGALDTQNREFLQSQLLEIQAVAKKTILFVTHDVEEAIFLADRLVILTSRPAKIKKELSITLPKPRELGMKTTEDFMNIKRDVLTFTRDEALKSNQLWQMRTEKNNKFRIEKIFSLRRHKIQNM